MLSQGGLTALVPAAPECLVNFPLGVMRLGQAARRLPMESLRTKLLN